MTDFLRCVAVCSLLLVAGCAPDITETDFYREHPDESAAGPEFVDLGTLTVGGQSVAVQANNELAAGWNTLRLRSSDADLSGWLLDPVFRAGSTTVTSPFPAAVPYRTEDGWQADVFFLQPPGLEGEWSVEVRGADAALSVTVGVSLWVQQVPEVGWSVAWMAPTAPRTGGDDLVLSVFAFDGTAFTAVSGLDLSLYPYMDMGGGEGHSTPFTDPAPVGDGRYAGRINFIMSGGWELTVTIASEAAPDRVVAFKGFLVH